MKPHVESQPSLSGMISRLDKTQWLAKTWPSSQAGTTNTPTSNSYFLVMGPTCMSTVSPEHASVG